jgi:hypothetical protein
MKIVKDDKRSGRPESTRTVVKIAAVADLIKNERRIASRMIAESLNIPKTVVLWIQKEELGICHPNVLFIIINSTKHRQHKFYY